MDTKHLARIGAIAFVAIAITMTAIEMREAPKRVPADSIDNLIDPVADPLRDALIRCQSIGEAGASDPACLRAWAENRRRFLAPGSRPQQPVPDAPSETMPVDDAEARNGDPAMNASR